MVKKYNKLKVGTDMRHRLSRIAIRPDPAPKWWRLSQKQYDDYFRHMWHNPREREQGGFRLTDEGFEILKTRLDLKFYEILLPKEIVLTNQVIIWLDKFIDCPYYLDKKRIVVFQEKMAVQLILFSGDVARFGAVKAITP